MIPGSLSLRAWGAIGAAVIIIALSALVMRLDGLRAGYKAGWDDEKTAHAQTVTNYRAAAAEAERRAQANVGRVKAEQEEITHDEVAKANARAVDRDARYQRLLAQARTYTSRPRATDLPDTSDATCLAYAGTDCAGIPPLLKAAQENTDTLIGLQDWVRRQAAIQVTQ